MGIWEHLNIHNEESWRRDWSLNTGFIYIPYTLSTHSLKVTVYLMFTTCAFQLWPVPRGQVWNFPLVAYVGAPKILDFAEFWIFRLGTLNLYYYHQDIVPGAWTLPVLFTVASPGLSWSCTQQVLNAQAWSHETPSPEAGDSA